MHRDTEPFIRPDLLIKSAQRQPLTVFLCGPGVGAIGHDMREAVRDKLQKYHAVSVKYGEDITSAKAVGLRKTTNLQNIELHFANEADFTLLILDSPGSMAELGTFSMIQDIVPRLFVAVPAAFYRAESYIARGPLSIISNYSKSNVIYYDKRKEDSLQSSIDIPVSLFKYISYSDRNYRIIKSARLRYLSGKDTKYREYILDKRSRFVLAITLMAILVLDNVTFGLLISRLRISPDEISGALRELFSKNKILKLKGEYKATTNFSDKILNGFSPSAMSQLRARFIGLN